MRFSGVLHIRNLLAKLHPPLPPPTPRESQRLLAVINDSFKQYLDVSHPAPRQSEGPLDISVSKANEIRRSIIATEADSRLSSVLSHPAVTGGHVAESEHVVREFQAHVHSGTMSHARLHYFALKYLRKLGRSEVPNEFGLGVRIAAWLQSGSNAAKLALTMPASPDVVRLMYAEGQEEAVWKWLEALYQAHHTALSSHKSSDASPEYLAIEDQLIRLMVRQDLRRGRITEAVQQFVHASQYRAAARFASVLVTSDLEAGLQYRPLVRSFEAVANVICTLRGKHGLDAKLFDDVLRYQVNWEALPMKLKSMVHTVQRIESALLEVYHPTKPSASAFLGVLQEAQVVEQFKKDIEVGAKWASSRQRLSVCIVDAAILLAKQGDSSGAKLLFDVVGEQSRLPSPENSATTSKSPSRANEVQSHMQSLAGGFAID